MNEWITDRLPTQEDATDFERVMIPCNKDPDGWIWCDFKAVELGEPWAPYPKMPPYKTDEQLARESLPEGYRFVGRGNGRKPLFTEMRFDAIRWDDSKSNWQITTLGTNGTYESAFYAVPEEPEEPAPEHWECPEDIPPNAIWFLDSDGDCDMIQTVTAWGLILAQDIKIRFDELAGWRWNDRPFSRFNEGKLCTKETTNDPSNPTP